jgi:hypothetical protein
MPEIDHTALVHRSDETGCQEWVTGFMYIFVRQMPRLRPSTQMSFARESCILHPLIIGGAPLAQQNHGRDQTRSGLDDPSRSSTAATANFPALEKQPAEPAAGTRQVSLHRRL